MKKFSAVLGLFALAAVLLAPIAARAQTTVPGQRIVPLWNCQLSAALLASSVGLSSCVAGSFTGTGSGTTLTAASVSGVLLAGQTLSGTGVPAGTTIVSQLTGTAGGAGTYRTSVATTSSGASLTAGGIPSNATAVVLQGETANVRYRDDGGAPTTAIGLILVSGTPALWYPGTLSKLRFIAATGSPLVNVAFYR